VSLKILLSFKVTQGHSNLHRRLGVRKSHCNYRHILYRFGDKVRYWSKIPAYVLFCSYPLYLTALRKKRSRLFKVVHGLGRPAGWVGSGWVEILQFSMGWVEYDRSIFLMITQHTTAYQLSCSVEYILNTCETTPCNRN